VFQKSIHGHIRALPRPEPISPSPDRTANTDPQYLALNRAVRLFPHRHQRLSPKPVDYNHYRHYSPGEFPRTRVFNGLFDLIKGDIMRNWYYLMIALVWMSGMLCFCPVQSKDRPKMHDRESLLPNVKKLFNRMPMTKTVEYPGTAEQWAEFEMEVGHRMPTDYYQFVRHYGDGSAGGDDAGFTLMIHCPFIPASSFIDDRFEQKSKFITSPYRNGAIWAKNTELCKSI
jgi:hypothetical protein